MTVSSKESMGRFDDLTPDLMYEILKRLSLKKLLISRHVCKPWSSLVMNREFLYQRLAMSIANKGDNKLILRYYSVAHNKEVISVHDNDEIFKQTSVCEESYKSGLIEPDRILNIVGSCAGLYCLSGNLEGDGRVVIWNPTLKKAMHLPPPPSIQYDDVHKFSLGFGYSTSSEDFKVVRVVFPWDNNVNEFGPEIEIFDLCTGRGRTKDCDWGYYIDSQSSIFTHGASHWIAFKYVPLVGEEDVGNNPGGENDQGLDGDEVEGYAHELAHGHGPNLYNKEHVILLFHMCSEVFGVISR